MLLELKADTNYLDKQALIERLENMGFRVVESDANILAIIGGIDSLVVTEAFAELPNVAKVHPLTANFKLASRQTKASDTIITIKNKQIGGKELFIIAGPCSIESREQLEACAKVAKENGAHALRGGAYKPRTSPYEFQGMGVPGLELIAEIGAKYDLVTVSEVMEISQLEVASKYLDVIQIGARNMQNYGLLTELGKIKNPVLLKRGFAATYQELLMAAEYIMLSGNPNVILCERGIRTFETFTRNTLDLNAVPALQQLTHLPIVADPSHGTGVRSLVLPMARASVAAGAHGILVEMHPNPDKSISDAKQTLSFETFAELTKQVRKIKAALE
ncbi:3-deoxy-7-phosphoheptulonate synthase [Aquella oligotrophica]|uniref:3-deoxy-7-phosphoheptulonate synthase n=1 Tax=Aquella oligotrophica TaxID=2067065 RepID=A0A2I7N7B6_9NEIS|nr:3-deoxy-7-phosphoheptulonate synthase [Aquella oligotrophica]AUR52367.1 3-deoxy-7-phosphoheptulonate synthase [Aquella oligotrophica]